MTSSPDSSPDTVLAPDALQRHSVRGGLATGLAQGLQLSLRVGSQIVIARFLFPQDVGLLAIVTPVLSLVGLVANFGLAQAILQDPDIKSSECDDLFWLGLAVNLALALLIALGAPLLSAAYRDPRLTSVCVILAAMLPLSAVTAQQTALLNRDMRFGLLAGLDILRPLAGLAVGLPLAIGGWGYWSLVFATVAEAVASALFVFAVSDRRPGRPRYNRDIWRLVKVGGHITGSNLAGYVTTTFDNILLGAVCGTAPLGLYDRAYRIVTNPVAQFTTPFGRVALPLLQRLRSDDAKYRSTYINMVRMSVALGTPGILTVLVFTKSIFLALLGPRWSAIAPIATWMCVGALASTTYASTFWLFASQGRTAEQLRYVTVTSIVSVLGFLAGLPWGAIGVAAGGALSFLFVSTPMICWGATREGAVRSRAILVALVPLALVALVTAGVLGALSMLQKSEGQGWWLFLAPIVAYGCFTGLLFTFPAGRRILASVRGIFLLSRRAAPGVGARKTETV